MSLGSSSSSEPEKVPNSCLSKLVESKYSGQVFLDHVIGLHLNTQKKQDPVKIKGTSMHTEGLAGVLEKADFSEESGTRATSFGLLSAVLLAFLAQQRPGFWACLAF